MLSLLIPTTLVYSSVAAPRTAAAQADAAVTWGPTRTFGGGPLDTSWAPGSLNLSVGPAGATAAAWLSRISPRFLEFSVVVVVRSPRCGWSEPTVVGIARSSVDLDVFAPRVAVDGRGDVTVLWASSDRVFTRSMRSCGGWGPAVQLNRRPNAPFDWVDELALAVNGRGDAVAAWGWSRDDHSGVEHTASAYRAAGGRWRPQVVVFRERVPYLRATLDRLGGAVIYAADGDGRVTLIRRRERGWLSPRTLIRPKRGFFSIAGFDVAGNARGDQVVVMSDPVRRSRVWARTKPAGQRWSRLTKVGDGRFPAVAIDGAGRATVVFGDAASRGVASVARGNRRGAWSVPRVLATRAANYTVSANGSGAVVVAWVQPARDRSGPVIRASYRPVGGVFGRPLRLTPRDTRSVAGPLKSAVRRNGQAVVVWASRRQEEPPGRLSVRLRQTSRFPR
jgi:hypothetical protein